MFEQKYKNQIEHLVDLLIDKTKEEKIKWKLIREDGDYSYEFVFNNGVSIFVGTFYIKITGKQILSLYYSKGIIENIDKLNKEIATFVSKDVNNILNQVFVELDESVF